MNRHVGGRHSQQSWRKLHVSVITTQQHGETTVAPGLLEVHKPVLCPDCLPTTGTGLTKQRYDDSRREQGQPDGQPR